MMKLKSSFIAQKLDDVQFLVPVGREAFSGIVRGNATVAFIVEQLQQETTEEKIVGAMCERYDAPADVIAADLRRVLEKLRGIGALEE